jgi:hypothetical protein
MEIETMDPFIGYTNQKGKRMDIAQRANPPFPQAWRTARPTIQPPIMSTTQFRDQNQPPTTDQMHTPESLESPNYMDKYTTIHNILQVGVAVIIILLYRKTFIGNADEKCRHGGGGKRKWKAVKRRQRQ